MNKSLGHAGDEQSRDFPLKLAIAQIVGEMPPFRMYGAKCFADLNEVAQSEIEDWCSNKIVNTEYGYWMTGSSIVDAAEVIVRLAVENGNIHADLDDLPVKRTVANPDGTIKLEDFVNQKSEERDREIARNVADYERGLPSHLKYKDGHLPSQ